MVHFLFTVGKRAEATELVDRAKLADPLSSRYALWSAFLHWQGNQTEQTLEPIVANFRRSPQYRQAAIRIIIDHRSRTGELDHVRGFIEACSDCSQALRTTTLSMLDAAKNDPPDRVYDDYRDTNIMGFQFIYAFGGQDLTLDAFQYYSIDAKRRLLFFTVPWTLSSELAKDEEFFQIASDAGLVSYWRSRGWPDGCEPEGDGGMRCD